ncbi:unnamed protein product [Schistosoma curassoni]|uniref:Uncharacterized protein n=1 Tax=Schistosoma curassoni TaxID=6186 RepID=A0A183JSN0_9TREM|nr:unnamed protein product [Schistosoma curassoni]
MLIDSFMAFTESISTSYYVTKRCGSCYSRTVSHMLFTTTGSTRLTC